MLKLAGMALIVLCSSMMGASMASGLSARAAAIEEAIRLVGRLHDQLRYLQPTVGRLLTGVCGQGDRPAYLEEARRRMAAGNLFPESWRGALAAQPDGLGGEEAALVASLAELLGAADLDSQLAGLDFTREQLERRLELARRDCQKYQKLYSTLGVLGGLAVAIILM